MGPQELVPSVQHENGAHAPAEIARAELEQGLAGGLKQAVQEEPEWAEWASGLADCLEEEELEVMEPLPYYQP